MTSPAEKAKELVEAFYEYAHNHPFPDTSASKIKAKACAIIAVDEILEALKDFYSGPDWMLVETMGWQYWNKVKEEINKL